MEKDKTNEVCSLAAEFVQELKELPTDDYLRIKLMMEADAPTRPVKEFLRVVFDIAEARRPLLIGARDKTSESDGSK